MCDNAKPAAELAAPALSVESLDTAILRALPDLMFVLGRDGTFIDFHVRDPKLLFVPPGSFLGRNVRHVLPPPLGDVMGDALERAWQSNELVVVEYELAMNDRQNFEARIVRV